MTIDLFMSKPTYSSKYRKNIQPGDFPDIFICPMPSYKLEELEKHGYHNSFEYSYGHLHNTKFAGAGNWGGNYSLTPEKVIDDISIYKNLEDCPRMLGLPLLSP